MLQLLFRHLLEESIAGLIVFVSIVLLSFALTGKFPPPALVWGASLGGAASPLCWRLIQFARFENNKSLEHPVTPLPDNDNKISG